MDQTEISQFGLELHTSWTPTERPRGSSTGKPGDHEGKREPKHEAIMKRYRVLEEQYDSRPFMLTTNAPEALKSMIRAEVLAAFGQKDAARKLEDFKAVESCPFSVVSFHCAFLAEVRNSFVLGSYYPALAGACALGERVLNHLILKLRGHYRGTPQYKKVYSKESFDNWDLVIETLEEWEVLLPDAASSFQALKETRNSAIHFKPEVDQNARELGLRAIHQIQKAIDRQFGSRTDRPWYIDSIDSGTYVAAGWEGKPFVKEIILPRCSLVGPQHRLRDSNRSWVVEDDHEYAEIQVSDEEFGELLKTGKTVD